MNLTALTPPPDPPITGARIPALVIHVALAIVGILLTLMNYGATVWLFIGVPMSLLAASAPKYLSSWALIVFLALGQLTRPADLTWQLLVLIFGVQLLHLLGTLALALPWRTLLKPDVFKRPLQRLVAIQIPVQGVAVLELSLLAPNSHGHRPLTLGSFTIVGAIALGALALLLLRRTAANSR
ncbi:MAG: hypothetical protein ACRDLT_10595 [Solirubrobacteraceae bacterium]